MAAQGFLTNDPSPKLPACWPFGAFFDNFNSNFNRPYPYDSNQMLTLCTHRSARDQSGGVPCSANMIFFVVACVCPLTTQKKEINVSTVCTLCPMNAETCRQRANWRGREGVWRELRSGADGARVPTERGKKQQQQKPVQSCS